MNQNTFKDLIGKIKKLHEEAITHTLSYWKPEAEWLIHIKSKDSKAIERNLDALLETAFNDEVLIVFKNLCRYYYEIDQQAAIDYVGYYREMWDNEE